MIEIQHLTHSLGGKTILNDITLNLSEGGVMGLIGINGAGKSTLLRLISGVYRPDAGTIFCDGIDVQDVNVRKRIFFLPDDPYFTISSTGWSIYRFYRTFYPQMNFDAFVGYMQTFKLDPKKPLRNFSKGMRRQLYVALALAIRPKYLLLDEAFDGLDPLARLTFKREINRLVEEQGTGVMISSHSLRELEDFCDSYALIDRSTIAASGGLAENVARFCKFQLAFADPPMESLFADLPVASLEINGRFVRVILEGASAEMLAMLEALNPLIVEEMPIDFEEYFIHSVGKEVL